MTFVDSIKTCFSKYADFKGRASRSEYWWFMLFYVIVYVALMVLAATLETPLLAVAILALFIPILAVSARRLHDTDRSGWMMLIGLIPLVGLLVIYFMIQEGKEPNRFGTAPTA